MAGRRNPFEAEERDSRVNEPWSGIDIEFLGQVRCRGVLPKEMTTIQAAATVAAAGMLSVLGVSCFTDAVAPLVTLVLMLLLTLSWLIYEQRQANSSFTVSDHGGEGPARPPP